MTFTDCSVVVIILDLCIPPPKKNKTKNKQNAVPIHEKKKHTEEYGTAHGWCSSPQAAR